MEDGLRGSPIVAIEATVAVLILVLVEDGLRDHSITTLNTHNYGVLILVLVEDGLRVVHKSVANTDTYES